MPLPLLVAGIAAAGSVIAGLVEAGSVVGTLIAVGLTIWRVYVLIGVIWAAFWFTLAAFGREVMAWVIDLYFWLASLALDAVGMPNIFEDLATLIGQLPPKILEFLAWMDIFSNMAAMLAALFVNWGLRSLPLVGHLFRG